ncbi:Fic family protein [Rhodohalobacter sulfatireducens]|uniref:Fic family protein n=1 Tax=Rhodohalobacter sulfatireducens TaxID=2911366 RepID=A0ABS9KH10_9BACT|nr:Fic family protein [Rhodohalobacter sulfatireducens]MCG2590142.1 Fic family protein [Rhodohalobacter sulfatireducens]
MFPRESSSLVDLVMEVYRKSASLDGLLHPITQKEVTRLLRHINSYYSNRIEGEHTTPADIEKAVKKEYSKDEDRKRLQLLSVAHIEVQALIDEWLAKEPDINVCSKDFLCSIHREFYARVPESFLNIYDPESGATIQMVPGELRNRLVTIGDHVPPTPDSVERFISRFEEVYTPDNLLGHKKLITAAASHHRLAWIHPFLDGNGRVNRLFSYAYMKKVKLDSLGLWTISRGLARRSDDYINYLAVADANRKGDYDGRGNLSQKGLTRFCKYFFEVAEDQISFMIELLQLENLRERIIGYVNLRSQNMIPDDGTLREEAKYVLAEIMTRGEVARGEVKRISGLGERTARDLTSQLVREELITSESHRSPLRFNIPGKVVGYYFPKLYPEGSI